jgi:hypothetical protein
MRKAVLRNQMALNILTAAQGRTYPVLKAECCVYIPDNSGNVTLAQKDLHNKLRP